jgi:hypothetical protein
MAKRHLISQLYRPMGNKPVRRGSAWASGGALQIAQGVDLSLPIRGFRLMFSGRLVVGTTAITTPTPEGLLNLISRIRVTGTNRRQGGNVTLWDLDLATLWTMQHLFERSAAFFTINDVHVPVPTTPFPAVGANGYQNSATGTYDFRIGVDIPFHPFNAPPGVVAGFLVRGEEYKDSIQVQMDFGTVTNGAVAGALGTGAAGTTYVFSSYGSAAGSPTIDLYSLPMTMGLDLKDAVLPGILARTQQQLAGLLQAAGNGITLLDMQKKKTTRVILKVGTTALAPYFATLSDTNVTQIGINLGGNRVVRDLADIYAYKAYQQSESGREPIQGYNVLDFIQSGNPDSAYPADQIGDGSKFELVANVTGVANAFGIAIQEQMIFAPDGDLYNPA